MEKQFVNYLNRVRRWLALKAFLDRLLWYLPIGLLAGTACEIVACFTPWYSAGWWAAGFPTLGIVAAIVHTLLRFPAGKEAAAAIDSAGLKERAQTAWELLGQEGVFARLQLEDAWGVLSNVQYRKSLPLRFHWGRSALLAVFAAALLACAGLPSQTKEEAKQQHLARELARKEWKKVEKAQAELEKRTDLSEAERAEAARVLSELRDELGGVRTKKELAKALERSRRKLEQAADRLGGQTKEMFAKLEQELAQRNGTGTSVAGKGDGSGGDGQDGAGGSERTSERDGSESGNSEGSRGESGGGSEKGQGGSGGDSENGRESGGGSESGRGGTGGDSENGRESGGGSENDRGGSGGDSENGRESGGGSESGQGGSGGSGAGGYKSNGSSGENGSNGQTGGNQSAGGSGTPNSGSPTGTGSSGTAGSAGTTGTAEAGGTVTGSASGKGSSGNGGNGTGSSGSGGNKGTSGSGSGGSQGSSGSGSGSQGSSGSGGSGSQGSSGSGAGGRGAGQGGGSGSGSGSGWNYGSNRGTERETTYDGELVAVPRETGDDGNLTGRTTDGESYQAKGGESSVWRGDQIQYDQVIGEYSDQAMAEIRKSNYPAGVQDIVKSYFDGLD